MALSAPRNTPAETLNSPLPVLLTLPVADNKLIYAGAFCVLSAGYVAPATAATGLIPLGRARATYDNTVTGHTAGAFTVDVEQGVFRWTNSSSTDAIAQANVGADCFLVDDQTVALTDGNGTRSLAGKVVGVDSAGVYVNTFLGCGNGPGSMSGGTYPRAVISVPIDLVSAANSAVAARITPGFAGRILKTSYQVTKVTTNASKAGTLTPNIAAAPVTGGVIALASNTDTGTLGATKSGTTVSAANTFGATDELTVVWSSVTAFLEGAGVLFIHLG